MDKGEKMEKEPEKKEAKKVEKVQKMEKKKSPNFFQVGSFILLLVLIIVVLIVFQVPYTTTNAVSENVPVEKCTQTDIPFAANFRTGLEYNGAVKIPSSDGSAIYRYSELKSYVFANIRNTGDAKGVYCINADPYLITNFTNDEDSLTLFESLIASDSDTVLLLDEEVNTRYTYPICTDNPINPTQTGLISLWTPNIISEEIQNNYNPDDVYVLFTIVPPTTEKCETVSEEQTTEQEITRYCNAWKHLVGKC